MAATCTWVNVRHNLIGILSADKLDLKRRRTERIRRERIDSSLTNDMENRRRSRANSQSDPIRRGRGRPKTVGVKKQEEDKGKSSSHLLDLPGPCYRFRLLRETSGLINAVLISLFFQRNRKRKWTFTQVSRMRRLLCSLWPWLKSTARSWARHSSSSRLREPEIRRRTDQERLERTCRDTSVPTGQRRFEERLNASGSSPPPS